MPERSKTLAEIQEECRRFASETDDPRVSRILIRTAEAIEQHALQNHPDSVPTKH
jgi:hypothetical protein